MLALKKFVGQTAIYGLSTIATRVLNFFLTPIYTTVYAPLVYGIFTKLYAWASVLNAIMAFGMETTFFRFLNKKEGQKEVVYSTTFFVVAFITFLFVITTYIFVNPIAAWMQEGTETSLEDYTLYIKYFVAILAVDALTVIPFARVRAEGKPARYALIKFLNVLCFILLNLFFIFGIPFIIENKLPFAAELANWYKTEWIGYVFISNLIASALTFLLLLPEVLKLKFSVDRKLLAEMFSYSWPILAANLSFIINENSDKIFLAHLLPPNISDHQVGIYGASSKIAIFMSIFIQAFRLGAEPFFFSTAKEKDAKSTYALIMSYFIIALVLIYVGIVANLEILKYFIGKDYWEGLAVVPILLLGYLGLGIYTNLSVWYKLSDQTKYGLYISGIGAILTIVLNVIFIPILGIIGSAIISLVVYSSMTLMSYLWGQKHYPIPYNLKQDVSYIVIACFLVFVFYYVIETDIIVGNILFILFTIYIVYKEKNKLKIIINKDENKNNQ